MKEDRLDRGNDNEEKNPHEFLIVNDFKKINIHGNTSQMEQ